MKKERIFIGGAWPYANGSLHLGHLAALLPADVLARYFRSKGDEVLFVSGSDCHGTPISVAAEKQGVEPAEIAAKYDREFRRDLIERLGFSYDLFSKTTSLEHKKTVQEIFLALLAKKLIYKQEQELPYCEKCSRFLPDRYIEGVCPKCGFENARGDQCDQCGSLLDAKELKNPVCKHCGTKPRWKKSEHFFLKLSALEEKLKAWVKPQKNWRLNAYQFTLNTLKGGLKDRAITRDIDWGVEIPIKGFEDKKIYVWFEAVCGYLSASREWDSRSWKNFWQKECRHYYVHGKDNILFHTIIWPAILLGAGGLNLPTDIISSEYLNLEGKQFSTSRGWAVWLPDFLDKFDADTLRYYLTINGPENTDTDFSWRNFEEKNNAELVGNFGNFIHRVLGFSYKNFGSEIPQVGQLDGRDNDFLVKCEQAYESAGQEIENGHFRQALKIVFGLAEEGNRYIDFKEPWKTIKSDENRTKTALNVCLRIIFNLRNLINPFLPFSAQKISALFGVKKDQYQWSFQELPQGLSLPEPQPIYKKIAIEEEKK